MITDTVVKIIKDILPKMIYLSMIAGLRRAKEKNKQANSLTSIWCIKKYSLCTKNTRPEPYANYKKIAALSHIKL